jgi:hypothetical protein
MHQNKSNDTHISKNKVWVKSFSQVNFTTLKTQMFDNGTAHTFVFTE